MTAKTIVFHREARTRIAQGLAALASAVKVTLGPCGRHVLLEKSWGPPLVTKDGVTVAKEIELEDRLANIGAQMVKEVASRTSDAVGDGTTTATVLAQALYLEGDKLVAAGHSPMDIKRGIDAAVETVVGQLRKLSKRTAGKAEIAQVGMISANGDAAIGDLLAEAMEKVGKEGVVTIEEANSTETSLEVVEGMQFDRGYLSSHFVTDTARMETVLQDAFVLIHDQRIATMDEILPLLEQVVEAGKPLLVIAEEIEGEALAALVVNKLRGTLDVCAVKAPGFGDGRKETLQDIAVLTGGQAVTADLGLELTSLTLKDLGRAKRIVIDKDSTTLIDGAGDKAEIEARVRQLRLQLEEATSPYDRDKVQERLAKLVGGVAVIKVGAVTESALKEKQARVEDALHATRAALEEGIVPGGGVALLRTIPALDALVLPGEQQVAVALVRRALEAPLRQIAANAGVEGSVVVDEVRAHTGAFGYNAASGVYEDLIAAGVIDPTKVVRVALQNAASVAGLMLTTEALIAERQPGDEANGGSRARRGSSVR